MAHRRRAPCRHTRDALGWVMMGAGDEVDSAREGGEDERERESEERESERRRAQERESTIYQASGKKSSCGQEARPVGGEGRANHTVKQK